MLRAREIQETGDQRIGAVDFVRDIARPSPGDFVFLGDVAREQLGRRLHGAQRIAKFVRQAGGQLPKRGQPFGSPHLRLGFFQALVGGGELLGGSLILGRFVALAFGELMGQVADHQHERMRSASSSRSSGSIT